jgi:hypothetical protein
MITSAQCLKVLGEPSPEREGAMGMVLWDVPTHLEIGVIPKRLYCNSRMVAPLTSAFTKIISRGLINELKTWDGCYNIRKKRGGRTPSLHSWGLAIDVNATGNGLGEKPTMSKELVACFTESGFDWGGTWNKPDGMHFQLSSL